MIALPEIGPSEGVLRQLEAWQALVDAEPGYEERVARAPQEWDRRNRRGNETFDEVKALLDQMCCGGRRCMYCEDSLAHEIEHMWPKSLYPDLVFAWLNFLYACGACNQQRGNRFSLVVGEPGSERLLPVRRQPGAPLVAPPAGTPALIDPRREDPMRLLWLDLRRTFRLLPALGLSPLERERARYTLDVLPLNSDALIRQRMAAYDHYRLRLGEYVRMRDEGARKPRLEQRAAALLRLDHPTVWSEMKRQREALPELRELFTAAREAQDWSPGIPPLVRQPQVTRLMTVPHARCARSERCLEQEANANVASCKEEIR